MGLICPDVAMTVVVVHVFIPIRVEAVEYSLKNILLCMLKTGWRMLEVKACVYIYVCVLNCNLYIHLPPMSVQSNHWLRRVCSIQFVCEYTDASTSTYVVYTSYLSRKLRFLHCV